MSDLSKPALVALHDRREVVIDVLSTRFANDIIGMDEFERRVDLAHRAASVAELDALVSDLEPADTPGSAMAVPPASASRAVASPRPAKKRVLSILSSVQRKGMWRVPAKLRVRTVMGAIDLDFREAELGPGVTEVKVMALMGAVSVIVPPDLRVECDGRPLLGHFEGLENGSSSGDPNQPVLRITGVAIMGALEIAVLRPGETPRRD